MSLEDISNGTFGFDDLSDVSTRNYVAYTRGLICSHPRWWSLMMYRFNLNFNQIRSLTKFIVEDRFNITAKNVNYYS